MKSMISVVGLLALAVVISQGHSDQTAADATNNTIKVSYAVMACPDCGKDHDKKDGEEKECDKDKKTLLADKDCDKDGKKEKECDKDKKTLLADCGKDHDKKDGEEKECDKDKKTFLADCGKDHDKKDKKDDHDHDHDEKEIA